ncbi:hypothetical protein PIROE2DRAFT_63777, partial [Piromyces sp. E2]
LNGLKATLYRSIIIPGSVTKKDNKSIVNSIYDLNLKTNQYVFNPYEEKSVFLQIPIPENNISMKNTSLFIVQYYITLSLNIGMFSKNISLNLPISICHPHMYNCINNPVSLSQDSSTNVNDFVSTETLSHKKTFLNNLRSLSRKASVLRNKALLTKLCITSSSDDYEQDCNNPTSNSYTSYDETNNSGSYLQNESMNSDDMDEDTTGSEVTATENAYNSDIDKFSKYFSNKKVFRSLSADNNNGNNSNSNNNNYNNTNNTNNSYNDNSNMGNSSTTKINSSLSYSNSYNYGNNYRSFSFDNSSVKSKDSANQTIRNNSSSDMRNSNSNIYKNMSSSPVHVKPRVSSSNLKKVSSIEGANEDDDNVLDYSDTMSTHDFENNTSFLRTLSSPYMQPNENNYINYQPSRILNSSKSNISLTNSYSSGHDNVNETFNSSLYNDNSDIDSSRVTKKLVISSSYTGRSLEKNNSFHSNHSSYSHRKPEPENSSVSSMNSPYTRYHNKSIDSKGSDGNGNHHSLHQNKSSPLYESSTHNASFQRNYYNNEVNMNNFNFTQNCGNSSGNANGNHNNGNNSNSLSYQSPRSIPSSSPTTPPFSKKHLNNGNLNYSQSHSFGSISPMTPTLKHNFSTNSLKSTYSVDGFLNSHKHRKNTQVNPNTSCMTLFNTSSNNYNYEYGYNNMKHSTSSPVAIQNKSVNDKQSTYGIQNNNYKSSSYSTPPPVNPSSPYSVPSLSNYINQFQRRPSLKYY